MNKIFPTDHPDSNPPGVHEISRRKGWEMIRKRGVSLAAASAGLDRGERKPKWECMRFHREAILRLLAQDGAEILAIHEAEYEDGTPTLVLAAEDGDAKELSKKGVFMVNAGTPCPPDCP